MRLIIFSLLLFVYSVSAIAQTPSWLPTNGLAAWYPFTGNTYDSSGQNNHGISNGALPAPDKNGAPNKAFKFDGLSTSIQIPSSSSLDITGSITVSAWVKLAPNINSMAPMQILWRGDPQFANDPYALTFTGTYLFRRDIPSATTVQFTPNPLDSNFHHLVGVFDSSTSKYFLFFDGMVVDSQITSGLIPYPTDQMWNMIGAVDNGNSQNFNGTLDDITVHNRALSICEIRNIFYQNKVEIVSQPQTQSVAIGSSVQFVIATNPGVTYQWQLDSGNGFIDLNDIYPYSGTNTNTLTVTGTTPQMNNFAFRCIVKSGEHGCPVVSSPALVSVLTSVPDLEKWKDFTVSPNPVSNLLRINAPLSELEGDYVLLDSYGRVVLCGKLTEAETIVNTTELSAGVYMLHLQGKKQQWTKVIKE